MNAGRYVSAIMVGAMVVLGVCGQTVLAQEVRLEKDTYFYLQGHTVGE